MSLGEQPFVVGGVPKIQLCRDAGKIRAAERLPGGGAEAAAGCVSQAQFLNI